MLINRNMIRNYKIGYAKMDSKPVKVWMRDNLFDRCSVQNYLHENVESLWWMHHLSVRPKKMEPLT